MQFTFPTSRSKYWLDKDFAFVRVFGTRYALRARRATKALRCFTILTLTLFLSVYFRFRPCVNRKIVATRKCSWHVCASCHLRCQFFSDIFTKQPHPLPRVNLWVGGWLHRLRVIVLKLRSRSDAVYAARLAARYCFSNLRVGCV